MIILIVCASTIITSCDFYDNPPVTSKQTTCFTVVDDLSNSPLDSALVTLTIRYTSGVYASLSGTTDVQGKCCFEHEPASLYGLFVGKEGYVYLCTDKGFVPSPARLTPVAYLQLHVKNVPPNAVDDQIGITYPDATCSGSHILIFQGANVDTTVTLTSRPGNNSISRISWHNNVRTDSTLSTTMTSRNTTFVDILY